MNSSINKEKRTFKTLEGDGFPIISIKPERNSKCKCGSGKKTKHCCGIETRVFSTKTDRVTKRNQKKLSSTQKK